MEKQKFSSYLRHIRLIYVYFEKFTRYGTTQKMLGKTYGVSSPFTLPKGMEIEDACKVVSFLSEKVENENNIEPASENSVAKVSQILTDYGFVKNEGYYHGHAHEVEEPSVYLISTRNFANPINGVVDLFTVGGDFELFRKSDLNDRYFNWFTEGVTKQEIEEIFKKVAINEDENQNLKGV